VGIGVWVRITGAQVRNLLRYCYAELLKIFERLGVPVLNSLDGISDRPKSGRHEGLGTFNSHLWGGQDPPLSRISAAQTSRECSTAEVFLALITAISGGGHLRITDIGRSKVVTNLIYVCAHVSARIMRIYARA
jgi:hypothetical protein